MTDQRVVPTGMSYPLRFGNQGHLERSSGQQKIKENLRSIIFTTLGERTSQPKLGTSVNSVLFRNTDQVSAVFLASQIRNNCALYEPRVFLTNTRITPVDDASGVGVLRITLDFKIVATGELDQLVEDLEVAA